ncbi:MAG: peptidase M19 [Chloroflexi bacterium]|nr:peptidase M19 [Chloroflexota bacterium]MDL1943968.1 peptidase M19 [Chloroflexi bacterium CFX2]
MPLIVDAHADIAYNMLKYGRDYTRPAAETRRLEAGSAAVRENGDTLLGWTDYQRGQVALIFATLFATPVRFRTHENEKQVYKTFDEAHKLYSDQLDVYHRMNDSVPDKFRLIASKRDLELHLAQWASAAPGAVPGDGNAAENGGLSSKPVGMVILMEGAEAVRDLSELEMWHARGVRLIGPAWVGTRYCGGWKEPGPLTDDGRKLLAAMSDFHFTLDLSHMDERAAVEALDIYEGPIAATHANCAALMPNSNTNRHLSDRIIAGIVERDGVVGIVPFNAYLKVGWALGKNSREEVSLQAVANHIDHVCQIAGDSLHAGIGSDFDGGFGLQSVPHEIDTIADLQNLVSLLQARGYSETDTANILGRNWLARLKRDLP